MKFGKYFWTFGCVLSVVSVHGQNSRLPLKDRPSTIKKLVKPKLPTEAKETGLGGRLIAKVSVGASGDVVSVDAVVGPDWVCESVDRADVLALRRSAKDAALNTKFTPAIVGGRAVASKSEIVFQFRGSVHDKNARIVGQESRDEESSAPQILYQGPHEVPALPKPDYPQTARAVGVSGSVNVKVVIDEQGRVFSAEAVSGNPLLRPVARIAACKATFKPTRLKGTPVRVAGILTYNFVP